MNIETHITYTDFNIKRIVDQRKKIDIKILCLDFSMKIHNFFFFFFFFYSS